jgi:hypothetical protein|tara:strand:+ start:55 stop:585 length:531 start_codon:yes stop_codon:yes gene_type:complete
MVDYVLYRAYDDNEKLLYVGQSTSVMSRLKHHIKSSEWSGMVSNITLQRFKNERQLFRAELKAIQEEKPVYNRSHNRTYRQKIVELRLKIKQMQDEIRTLKVRDGFLEMQLTIANNALNFIGKLPLSDELRQGYELWKREGDFSVFYKDDKKEMRKFIAECVSLNNKEETINNARL